MSEYKRLTARNKNNLAYLVNVKPDEQEVDSPYKNTLQCIMDSFERLAQYEESGLSPEEAVNLAKEIKNLAEKVDQIERDSVLIKRLSTKGYNEGYIEIEKLLQAKAEGRLIELPCKVGERVWFINNQRQIDTGYVRWFDSGNPNNPSWTAEIQDPPRGPNFTDISSVYLTKEAAEAALKGGIQDG